MPRPSAPARPRPVIGWFFTALAVAAGWDALDAVSTGGPPVPGPAPAFDLNRLPDRAVADRATLSAHRYTTGFVAGAPAASPKPVPGPVVPVAVRPGPPVELALAADNPFRAPSPSVRTVQTVERDPNPSPVKPVSFTGKDPGGVLRADFAATGRKPTALPPRDYWSAVPPLPYTTDVAAGLVARSAGPVILGLGVSPVGVRPPAEDPAVDPTVIAAAGLIVGGVGVLVVMYRNRPIPAKPRPVKRRVIRQRIRVRAA